MISFLKRKFLNHDFIDDLIDKNTLLKFELKLLRFVTALTPKNSNLLHSIQFKIYRFFVHFMWIYLCVACVGDLFAVSNNLILLGEDLCMIIGLGLITSKYLIVFVNSEKVEEIVNNVMSLAENSHRNDHRKKYYSLRKQYMVFIMFISLSFHILSILFVLVFFLSADDGGLPLRVNYFIKFDEKLESFLFFIHQFFCLFYGLTGIVALDTVFGVSWYLIGLELDILGKEFEVMAEDCHAEIKINMKFNEVINIRMKCLIRIHQSIIMLADQLNTISSPQLICQIFCSNFTICLTGFEATLTLNDKTAFLRFFVYLGSAISQLLFWCLHGENVYSKSMIVGDCAFYNLPCITEKSVARNLVIIIARSQKPIKIKAGEMYTLRLMTFLSVISGSYSYFALLQTLNEADQ